MATATQAKTSSRDPARRRPSDPVTAYAESVTAGRTVAGPWVRMACARHLRDLRRPDLTWDLNLASHALEFFPTCLRLYDGEFEGQPFCLQPWQQFIVGSLFGWTGRGGARRFRHAYIEAGKGSGKTCLLAGIGLYGLVADGEPAAEIYAAAVARHQAGTMFRDAVEMAEASPALARRLDITKHNIASLADASFFRPISSEGRSLDGKRVHMALIDEIHEHPTSIVVDKLRKGTKGRRQPLILEITNSGFDRTSVCWEHHEYSIRVVRGVTRDDSWFSYVCALDTEPPDDPFVDESCWIKAVPNLGISLPLTYLRGEVARARGMPSETGITLRLNFCVWTQQRTRFIPIDRWLAVAEAKIPDAELVGVPCWVGLDLGQSDDFSACVVVWRLADGRVALRARFWIPERALQLHPDRPYEQWQREGALTVTEGDTTDYDLVEEEVGRLCRAWGVRDVGYDKRFAEQMALHLAGQGVDMIDTGQGFQLNEALATMLDLVKTGRLLHEGHPVLTWMADNLVVKHGTKGEVRPDKPSAKDKIDGMVALAMAIDRMIRTSDAASVYETRGVVHA